METMVELCFLYVPSIVSRTIWLKETCTETRLANVSDRSISWFGEKIFRPEPVADFKLLNDQQVEWKGPAELCVEERMDGLRKLCPEGRFDIITLSLWSLQRQPWSRRWRITRLSHIFRYPSPVAQVQTNCEKTTRRNGQKPFGQCWCSRVFVCEEWYFKSSFHCKNITQEFSGKTH